MLLSSNAKTTSLPVLHAIDAGLQVEIHAELYILHLYIYYSRVVYIARMYGQFNACARLCEAIYMQLMAKIIG
jgi:hypothetical protein